MILTRGVWVRLLGLEAEFAKRGEQLTRSKIKEAFCISEHDARFLQDALRFRHIISMSPDSVTVEVGARELILSDIHIPYQDKAALEAALSFGDEFRPTIITLLGDVIDFYQISRFIKSPAKRGVSYEIRLVREFLADLRKRFPNAEIRYLAGNHEARWETYVMSQAKEIYDLVNDLLAIKLGFSEYGIDYSTEFFRIGKLWHLHGHEKGMGQYNPENICNVMFNFVLDSFVCGHYHRGQDKIYKRIDQTIFSGTALGYLAGEMDYAILNKWTQGFATVEYGVDGKFRLRRHSIYNGEIF